MLDFQTLRPELSTDLAPYYQKFGENSCQHSFISSYCMEGKYGDRVCVKDGFLYTLRALTGSDRERIYLFPLGDLEDEAAAKAAVCEVLSDAGAHDASVCFKTITARAAAFLEKHFGDRFLIEEVRDYAEYLYTYEKLANLPGHEMASKRYDIHTFERHYEGRYEVRTIETEEQIDAVRAFQEWWLREKEDHEEDVQLELENEAIDRGLTHFFELGLAGIMVYVDGEVAGYAYGAPLSPECFDVIIEKGDRRIEDIYRILNRDLVRVCCAGYAYINREEDLGVEGLRKAKLSYKPDILLQKYIARERRTDE